MSSEAPGRLPERVTFVMWQFPEGGGCGRATELVARGLRDRGIAVDFISMVPGIAPTDLPTLSVLMLGGGIHDRPVFRQTAGLAKKARAMATLVAKRADLARGRMIFNRRMRQLDTNSVVVFSNVRPKKLMRTRSARPDGPVIVGQHHSSFAGAERTGQLRDIPTHFADADAFVALTRDDARLFENTLPVLCVSIPNISAAQNPTRPDSASRIAVALTRYSSEKQVDVMIDAFDVAARDPQLKDWELHIYGSGELKADLQALACRKTSGRRIYLRDRTTDVPGVLSGAALNLMTSQYEGFPMAILEASAHGIPTVAFDCSAGVQELVTSSTGALVPAGDYDAYAEALRDIMRDEQCRKAKGDAARVSVERYSEPKVIDQWVTLFEQCRTRRERVGHG